ARQRRRPAADPACQEDAPAQLDDAFLLPLVEERRLLHRRGGSPVGVEVRQAGRRIAWGFVLDRSAHGLAPALSTPMATGLLVQVRPQGVSPVVPWVEVQVQHCGRGTDGWRVGCRFLATPPFGLLMLFG